MAFVIVTADEVTIMIGENVDATGNTTAIKEALELMAMSYLSDLMRYNIADAYENLNVDVKKIFSDYCTRFMAVALIAYNTSGFTSRIEAEDMINVHLWRMDKIEELVADQKFVTFIKGA